MSGHTKIKERIENPYFFLLLSFLPFPSLPFPSMAPLVHKSGFAVATDGCRIHYEVFGELENRSGEGIFLGLLKSLTAPD